MCLGPGLSVPLLGGQNQNKDQTLSTVHLAPEWAFLVCGRVPSASLGQPAVRFPQIQAEVEVIR
jgi:hypothetical protein